MIMLSKAEEEPEPYWSTAGRVQYMDLSKGTTDDGCKLNRNSMEHFQ